MIIYNTKKNGSVWGSLGELASLIPGKRVRADGTVGRSVQKKVQQSRKQKQIGVLYTIILNIVPLVPEKDTTIVVDLDVGEY